MLNNVLIINSLKREWRSKSFLFIFAFTIFFCFLLYMGLDSLKNNDTLNNVMDVKGILESNIERIFFFTFGIWSLFLSIILGVNCIRSDFMSKVIDQILSFPITRESYFLSRVFGTWMITLLYLLASYLLIIIVFLISGHGAGFDQVAFVTLIHFSLATFFYIILSAIFSFNLPKFVGGLTTFICLSVIHSNSSLMSSFYLENSFIDGFIIHPIRSLIFIFFPPIGNITSDIVSRLAEQATEINMVYTYAHSVISITFLTFCFLLYFKKRKV